MRTVLPWTLLASAVAAVAALAAANRSLDRALAGPFELDDDGHPA